MWPDVFDLASLIFLVRCFWFSGKLVITTEQDLENDKSLGMDHIFTKERAVETKQQFWTAGVISPQTADYQNCAKRTHKHLKQEDTDR